MTERESGEYVVRFSRWARFQHLSVALLFVALLMTGMPQKWPHLEASQWLIDAMGGIYAARWWHRMAGLVFGLFVLVHLVTVVGGILMRRMPPSMLFTRKDFQDAIDSIRYYLGQRSESPRFGRFDYRQKFEYWGMVFGGLVMVVTGLVLYFPVAFAHILPAELIPAAKVFHSNEALLAMLIVLVWHMYGAILNPEVFPLDTSIFTGKISKERMREEHPLEYEERFGKH